MTQPRSISGSIQRPLLFRASTLGFLAVLLLTLSCGCNRAYYRRQADAEAYALVREKATNPHWQLPNYSIAIDPRSRMHDPFSPDRPPLPPDDPTAHQFMHCVDGKQGYPGWHDNGEIPIVENPAWLDYLETDEKGIIVMGADDAVRLGLLHSRTYQQELEELYLSAIDVSFERFRFDGQGFAGAQTFYTADGPRRAGGGGESKSTLQVGTYSTGQRDIAYQKAFTSGSTLVVGLANSLVWQFSGPDDYRGNTLLDFAFVQPLLRNAGRDRIMERLTVAERTLLGNVRAMEQYRQAFYVQVMTGRDPGAGPARRGGVFGSGFDGFTGTNGGFGRVNTAANTGNASGGGQGAGAALVGGYLGLLQSQQQIRNQEDNVERLRSNLFRLEQMLIELKTRSGDPQLISNILRQDLQVAQARQALFNAESRLLNSRNDYQTTLDTFKVTLGLPPQLCLNVKDNLLDSFQLIDRDTMQMQVELERLVGEFGAVRLRITSHIQSKTVADETDPTRTKVVRVLPWYAGLDQDLRELQQALRPLTEVREKMLNEFLPRTAADLKRFAQTSQRRQDSLHKLQTSLNAIKEEPCPLLPIPSINPEIFKSDRLERTRHELDRQLVELQHKVKVQYAEHLQERGRSIQRLLKTAKTLSPEQLFAELYDGILYPKRAEAAPKTDVADILVVLPADLLALQLVQARARTESVQLSPVDIRAEQALEVARKYRRDWMNARAALVDSWRLIEFNADNLESSLNFLFSGDMGNTSDNPLALKSTTGRLRVGVQFDAPITRLAERNTYRQTLIEYQQARRSYYAFEDGVARGLRTQIRTAQNNQINFELQRLAVLEAARQIDRNEDIRIEQELSNQATGATAARDSVSALSDLLDAQNNFMSIYVNYEALRRSLDLDLGTLQLDAEGLWIDPEVIDGEYGTVDPWIRGNSCELGADGKMHFAVIDQITGKSAGQPPGTEILEPTPLRRPTKPMPQKSNQAKPVPQRELPPSELPLLDPVEPLPQPPHPPAKLPELNPPAEVDVADAPQETQASYYQGASETADTDLREPLVPVIEQLPE